MRRFCVLFLLVLIAGGCAKNNPIPDLKATRPGGSGSGMGRGSDFNIDDNPYQPSGLEAQGLKSKKSRNLSPGAIPGGAKPDGSKIPPNAWASVFFGYDKSAVDRGERSKLQEVVSRMQSDPSLDIIIIGHCDWRGTVEYNLSLGERRAKSVKRWLTDAGISGSRIEVNSRGDFEATENGNKSQMAEDRRADILPLM